MAAFVRSGREMGDKKIIKLIRKIADLSVERVEKRKMYDDVERDIKKEFKEKMDALEETRSQSDKKNQVESKKAKEELEKKSTNI